MTIFIVADCDISTNDLVEARAYRQALDNFVATMIPAYYDADKIDANVKMQGEDFRASIILTMKPRKRLTIATQRDMVTRLKAFTFGWQEARKVSR